MSGTNNRTHIASIVKFPTFALQKPASRPIRCAFQDVDRLADVDTTPVTLGIEGQDGVMIPVFWKGTVIPCETILELELHRGVDGRFCLNVFSGFSTYVKENLLTARTEVLSDSMPVHQWPVYVKLAIDGNGLLTAEVIDRQTKHFCEVRITYSSGLSDKDIADLEKK